MKPTLPKPYYETEKCACGCGAMPSMSKTKPGVRNKFVNGHNNKGKKFTDEHKACISNSMKRAWIKRVSIKPTPIGKFCMWCGNVFFIKKANRANKFCSYFCYKKYRSFVAVGERNGMYGKLGDSAPSWRGGVSFLPYPTGFNRKRKNEIRNIDQNVCQICESISAQRLDIHHIDYEKNNICTDNLISLCRSCHMKTNTNRECWKDYFRRRLNAP